MGLTFPIHSNNKVEYLHYNLSLSSRSPHYTRANTHSQKNLEWIHQTLYLTAPNPNLDASNKGISPFRKNKVFFYFPFFKPCDISTTWQCKRTRPGKREVGSLMQARALLFLYISTLWIVKEEVFWEQTFLRCRVFTQLPVTSSLGQVAPCSLLWSQAHRDKPRPFPMNPRTTPLFANVMFLGCLAMALIGFLSV